MEIAASLTPWLAALLVCGALSTRSPAAADEPAGDSPWTDAAGRVQAPDLAALCVDLWEEMLRADPIEAGRNGDARHLGRLPDESPAGRAERRQRLAALAERAAAVSGEGLDEADTITLQMARGEIDKALRLHDLDLGRWLVDPAQGVHVTLFTLGPDQPAGTEAERAALLQRWAAMPVLVDQVRERLQGGLGQGLVASRTALEKSVAQIEAILATPTARWPLAQPDTGELPQAERQAFLAVLLDELESGLRPALERLAATQRDELLPAARSDDAPGLSSLPGGAEAYAVLIAHHTGLALDAGAIHAIGRERVAAIRGEIARLGQRVFGTDDTAAIQRRLREDPELHFRTRAEVQAAAERSLAAARAAMPRWFGILPAADCVVVPIAPHEERESTIAYYRQPAADGSRPGRYFINTWAPATRPRYEAQVLAFHEAIPGHHLQIAIAQELAGVPRFQREAGSTAFVEGWALYTERLCDEMGLYDGDLDRLGMLSFDAWRACRLVVDTGLHAEGMSRDEAVAYMLENTLLAENNVVNEVDRYIANPGQALAYKLGQLAVLELRQAAEQALGERFDVRAFHDVVLSRGALTLPILQQRVREWISAQGS